MDRPGSFQKAREQWNGVGETGGDAFNRIELPDFGELRIELEPFGNAGMGCMVRVAVRSLTTVFS